MVDWREFKVIEDSIRIGGTQEVNWIRRGRREVKNDKRIGGEGKSLERARRSWKRDVEIVEIERRREWKSKIEIIRGRIIKRKRKGKEIIGIGSVEVVEVIGRRKGENIENLVVRKRRKWAKITARRARCGFEEIIRRGRENEVRLSLRGIADTIVNGRRRESKEKVRRRVEEIAETQRKEGETEIEEIKGKIRNRRKGNDKIEGIREINGSWWKW